MDKLRYQMKAVIFDILAECRELKDELTAAGVLCSSPFFGLWPEETLKEELECLSLAGEDCLFITNRAEHAEAAERLGMAVAGCMERHFTVPKATILLTAPAEVSAGYLNRIYCHEKKLPAMILETRRLYVRELTREDAEELYALLTDEKVSRYLPEKPESREEEIEKLVSYVACVYPFFEYGYWGVFLKETDRLIGRAGFQEGSYPPEAGYVITHALWGQGFGTEVLSALVHYAKEELGAEKLLAKMDERNTASVRVAEKCGFLYKETAENHVLVYQYCCGGMHTMEA